jgi:hypothetical protein
MTATCSWVINCLECYPQQNDKTDVVFKINWARQANDGTYSSSVSGSELVTLDPDAPFTPYGDLTEAQVTGWLEAAIGVEEIAAIDANLNLRIENQINPSVITPVLPWASPTTIEPPAPDISEPAN